MIFSEWRNTFKTFLILIKTHKRLLKYDCSYVLCQGNAVGFQDYYRLQTFIFHTEYISLGNCEEFTSFLRSTKNSFNEEKALTLLDNLIAHSGMLQVISTLRLYFLSQLPTIFLLMASQLCFISAKAELLA